MASLQQLSIAEKIAKARADIAAKIATYNQGTNKLGGPSPASVSSGPSVAAAVAAAQKSSATNAAAGTAKPTALDVTAMARQIAEAKRRALASQATRAVQENPYLVSVTILSHTHFFQV